MKNNNLSLFSDNVISLMREEIHKANGNEVFFVGKKKANCINEILPIAWGNENEVPIIYDEAFRGDYVIHNHPRGNLTPSSNDLNIASYLANQGIGFLIVNSSVTDYYTVVKAVEEIERKNLDIDKLISLIDSNGKIVKYFDRFERRESQIKMLKIICNAFNEDNIALIEAGTGVGKSMAYLIPAIHWSVINNEKVVISTNTINLQEQLCKKDIPFLEKALGIKFKAVLVKGRANYLCLRKLHSIKGDKENELFEKEEQQCIREILGSIDTFSEGTKDEIMNITLIEKWDKISSETDTCLKVKCEFFSKCFFFKARKEVNQSHLIVVNHHLLCSDIALKGEIGDVSSSYGLLPPYQKVIIDEAHNFEHVAINYFGYSVSWFGFKQTVSRLYHLKGSHEKGVLAFIKREITRWKEDKSYEIIDDIYNLLTEHIITDVLSLNPFIDDFFQMMTNYTEKTLKLTPFETKLRLIPDKLPDSIKHIIKIESSTLIQSISALYERLSQLHSKLEEIPFHLKEEILGNIKNLEAYNNRLLSALTNLETFVHFKESDAVYWIDYKKRNNAPSISLNVSPLNISDLLSEVFFITKETIILTSATLTTNNNFQFIKKELGLAQTPSNNITEAILPSPFNYKEQMSICIPTENPDPQDSDFSDRVNELLIDILEITLGNTFILFTSYGMLNHTYEHLKTHFDHRINLLKQGSASRHDLLNRFKNGNNSVLLGTDSFWEGVDVPGDALRCVILVKLPFKVPTEPITQGKIEKLEREGKNSFIEYSVPQSVIKFKQGFGRLIRTQEDRGVVICLDKRIITKSYGKIFLNSLPNCHQIIGNNSVILEKMSKYF